MATAATARGRDTRKPRTGPTVQGSTDFFNSNGSDNSLGQLQVQRVITLTGISPVIAAVLTPFVFGGVR